MNDEAKISATPAAQIVPLQKCFSKNPVLTHIHLEYVIFRACAPIGKSSNISNNDYKEKM